MKRKAGVKKETNPELIREQEEKRKTELLYSGEGLKRTILLYALLVGVNYPTYGLGYGVLIPPALFMKWFDD